jgi:prevent-host-death family protein
VSVCWESNSSRLAATIRSTAAFIMCVMILRPMRCGAVGSRLREGRTMRLNVVELRQSLAEILNRAEYQGERIIIHRRGKDVAAIVPLEDLKLLERLIEEVEDRLDVEAARVSMAESEGRIPYAEVRRRLGLEDEQKAKRKRAQPRARTI